MKLWSGRFEKNTDPLLEELNQSLPFDKRLYKQDILGSVAHVGMLGLQGIIPINEAELIQKTLKDILFDMDAGSQEVWDPLAEDIHTNIEKMVIRRIGDVGKKMHTGRSRNDQVTLDMRMYIKEEVQQLQGLIHQLQTALLETAKQHTQTILPGYTHMQRAQPITLAHHWMAYFEMLVRDRQRLLDAYNRTDVMPLGAGALSATAYPLDRYAVARELDFPDVTANSLDAVSDRDYCIELLSALSILMMHLSRFSEEIILWSSQEFNFIEVDDSLSTGSSIMPQKKNPDAAELIRGKTGRVYGSLVTLLTVMKGLPLAYNKDMQEDKEAVFDALDTVKKCVPLMTAMIQTMKINKDAMLQAAQGGFTNATDVADYLVSKGLPFRDAHEIVGKIVLYCLQYRISLQDLKLKEYQHFSPLFEESILDEIDIAQCVEKRNVIGGPSQEAMAQCFIKNENYLKFREFQLNGLESATSIS